MADQTPNMGLLTWDQETDPYSHTDLTNNAIVIDNHDHTPGKGAPLPPEALPTLDQSNLGVCSVNTPQICNGAVTDVKLASPAVRGVNIYADAVNTEHIYPGAVGSTELGTDAVTNPKVADSAIDTVNLVDNSVAASKIRDGAVVNAKLGARSVTSPKIGLDGVINENIADNAVDTPQLADGAVAWAKQDNNSVGVGELRRVPACYVTIDHRHSVSHNDFHQVAWDLNRYDTDDMWDRDDTRKYIFAKTKGLYLVEATIMWEDGGPGGGNSGRRAKIRRNNTPIDGIGPLTTLKDNPADAQAPYRVRLSMATAISLDQGDKLDVIVEQTSGSSQDIIPDGLNTHFSVVWIAPHPGSGNNFIPDELDS